VPLASTSSALKPAAAAGCNVPLPGSTSWIRTLSNSSASEIASQTEVSIASVEIVWGSCDVT